MAAAFRSLVDLFSDEFSTDLHGRRAEALVRLARSFGDGFLVQDFAALNEVFSLVVRRLEVHEATLVPGALALLQSFAKPYKRSRAAEERLPVYTQALTGILRSISDIFLLPDAPDVACAAADALVAFSSVADSGASSAAAGDEDDASQAAFHHRLLRESGALAASVVAFGTQLRTWIAGVHTMAGGEDTAPAVRMAALAGAKSPELLLTLGRLMLVCSEVPENADTMVTSGAVEAAVEGLAFFAQPAHNLHDTSLPVAVELLWNLCEHCFVALTRGAGSPRFAAPSIARLTRKHREVNALRRVLVDSGAMALGAIHALLGRLVREGTTQSERELRNDLLCVLSVLARASYAPGPFLRSGLAATLALLASAAENGLDVGCPLGHFASTSTTDKELKQLCLLTLAELCRTVLTEAPLAGPAPSLLDTGADGDAAEEHGSSSGIASGPGRGRGRVMQPRSATSRSASPAASRSPSASPSRNRAPASSACTDGQGTAGHAHGPTLAAEYSMLLSEGPLLPTLLLYLDVRERSHPYTSLWSAMQRRELELLCLRTLTALLPLVAPRLVALEGPAALLLYLRCHSGVLPASFRAQMRQAAADAGLLGSGGGGDGGFGGDGGSPGRALSPMSPHSPSQHGGMHAHSTRGFGGGGGAAGGALVRSSTLGGGLTAHGSTADAGGGGGGGMDAGDVLPPGPVDADRLSAASLLLARLCVLATAAGAPVSLPLLHMPALWRLVHTRPRLPHVPVSGGGSFGGYMAPCGADSGALTLARALADRDYSLIQTFVAGAAPAILFSSDDPRLGGSGCPFGAAGNGTLVPHGASGDLDGDIGASQTAVRQLGDLGAVRDAVALLQATLEASPLTVGAGGGFGGGFGAGASTVVGAGGQAQGVASVLMLGAGPGSDAMGSGMGAGAGVGMLGTSTAASGNNQRDDPFGMGGITSGAAGAAGPGGAGGGGFGASVAMGAAPAAGGEQLAPLQESLCLLLTALAAEGAAAETHARGRDLLAAAPALSALQPAHASPDLGEHCGGGAPEDATAALAAPHRLNRLRSAAAGAVPVLLALLRRAVAAARTGALAEGSNDETRPRVALAAVAALRALAAGLPEAGAQLVIAGGVDTLLDLAEASPRPLQVPCLACLTEVCTGREAAACAAAWHSETSGDGARRFLLRLWLAEETRLGLRRDAATGAMQLAPGASPLRILDGGAATVPPPAAGSPGGSRGAASPLLGPSRSTSAGPRASMIGTGAGAGTGAGTAIVSAAAATAGAGAGAEEGDDGEGDESEPAAFKSLRRALRAARMYGNRGGGSGGGGSASSAATGGGVGIGVGGGTGAEGPASGGGGGIIGAHLAAADLRPLLFAALWSLGLLEGDDGLGMGLDGGDAAAAAVTGGAALAAVSLGSLSAPPLAGAGDVALSGALDTARAFPSLLVGCAWDDASRRMAGLGASAVDEDGRVMASMTRRLQDAVEAVAAGNARRAAAYRGGVAAANTRLAATLSAGAGSGASQAARARLGVSGGAVPSSTAAAAATSGGQSQRRGAGADLGTRGSATSIGSGFSSNSRAVPAGGVLHQTMEERKAAQAHRAAMLERSFLGSRPHGADLRAVLEATGTLSQSPRSTGAGSTGDGGGGGLSARSGSDVGSPGGPGGAAFGMTDRSRRAESFGTATSGEELPGATVL